MAETENQNVETEETKPSTTAEVETGDVETSENQNETENAEETDNQKADKIVSKLQKRIGKEQAEKNDYKDQLKTALERITKLEKGEDPDKPEPTDEKDSEIAKLQAQIKRRDITDQARSVLTEGGINVPADVLNFIVSDDDKATLANVKAFIGYTQQVRDSARQEFLKGTTPRVTGQQIKTVSQTDFDAMTYAQRADLAQKDPQQFNKLTGGL